MHRPILRRFIRTLSIFVATVISTIAVFAFLKKNPMRFILAFLHLLEGQTKFICDIWLTQLQHEPAHAHQIADGCIDWGR